ncbi:MAG: HD domain-containing protein [Clostridia bacterium]|nr:HD domain-containing protein [Clostridia bacterium]
MNKTDKIYRLMMEFYRGDAHQIQHFVKVHSFAAIIGRGEGLSEREQFILEAAALVHDIGIKPAKEKYGSSRGPLQEQEGPEPAAKLLTEAGVDKEAVERICWLVAHHHTYEPVEGIDHRILLEADYLVNQHEGGRDKDAARSAVEGFFRTQTGTELCKVMFDL